MALGSIIDTHCSDDVALNDFIVLLILRIQAINHNWGYLSTIINLVFEIYYKLRAFQIILLEVKIMIHVFQILLLWIKPRVFQIILIEIKIMVGTCVSNTITYLLQIKLTVFQIILRENDKLKWYLYQINEIILFEIINVSIRG